MRTDPRHKEGGIMSQGERALMHFIDFKLKGLRKRYERLKKNLLSGKIFYDLRRDRPLSDRTRRFNREKEKSPRNLAKRRPLC